MAVAQPRVKVPPVASPGEIIKVKALISHPMESGQRKDEAGNIVPRKIINAFSCDFEGEPVFSCGLETAMAANPYFEFHVKVTRSGTFMFRWVDDDGTSYSASASIEVR